MNEQAPPLLGGRYQLEAVIGRGGMAEVWRARDIRLGRDVAIKRLRVDLAGDPTFQARFRREAQAAAGLNHPNIVSVYDTGEEIDTNSGVAVPYIVMELVQGVTLKDVLRDDRRILPERALEFTQGVLDALSYSHKAGIVHRDIKPANVMLTPTGTVKVMDFGIARAVADTSATMTQTAAVIGTAQYLSPEQARGETVDARSDIYSAGVLLFELLTGRPPFVGDSPVSVAYQHVRETPTTPSTLDPEITPPMDAVVMKALAKNPSDRYQSAREMRDDISRILAGTPVSAPPPAVPVVQDPTGVTQVVTPQATTGTAAPVTATQTSTAATPAPRKNGSSIGTRVLVGLLALLIAAIAYAAWKYEHMGSSTTPSASISASSSQSANRVTVPDVLGQTQATATSTLRNAGFKVSVTQDTSTAYTADRKGTVVAQSPSSGTLAKGSTVTITLPTIGANVPSLTKLSISEARSMAKQSGYTVEVVGSVASSDTAGTVEEQTPQTGSNLAWSTPIKVTVARAISTPTATATAPTSSATSVTPTQTQTQTATSASTQTTTEPTQTTTEPTQPTQTTTQPTQTTTQPTGSTTDDSTP